MHMFRNNVIHCNFSETLTEVAIDNYDFKVTWNPIEMSSCILWFKDRHVSESFEALGKFSTFDKKAVLLFLANYMTNQDLRLEIEKKRFCRKIETLPTTFFREIETLKPREKALAYKNMFNLDSIINSDELKWKRRVMATRFHPDVGGNDEAMRVINEAYDYLSEQTGK